MKDAATILWVDDDADVREILRIILEANDYVVQRPPRPKTRPTR